LPGDLVAARAHSYSLLVHSPSGSVRPGELPVDGALTLPPVVSSTALTASASSFAGSSLGAGGTCASPPRPHARRPHQQSSPRLASTPKKREANSRAHADSPCRRWSPTWQRRRSPAHRDRRTHARRRIGHVSRPLCSGECMSFIENEKVEPCPGEKTRHRAGA
jgi:hypothetical protein